jgi:hypothetical protein
MSHALRREDCFLQPGMRPGLSCVGRQISLEDDSGESRMGPLQAPLVGELRWGEVEFRTRCILARRIYAGILCELWNAIDRCVL